jgi:radical SAM superfamily enzyme YgiQ (UPF0313 family)
MPWPAEGRHLSVVAYANSYHVGMSNLGLHRVLEMLAADPDFRPRRAFMPDGDLAKAYDRSGATLLEVDTNQPVGAARMLAFSIAFEEDYLRVPKMLSLAGVPLLARERGAEHPLVIAGGFALALNPEPIAPFVDLVVFGPAERHLPALLDGLRDGLDREALDPARRADWLIGLGHLPGVYHPAGWIPEWDGNGQLSDFRRIDGGDRTDEASRRTRGRPRVETVAAFPRATISPKSWEGARFSPRDTLLRYNPSLSGPPPRTLCLTPNTEFSDRFLVLVGSGCHYGCRFCTAGYANRPPSAYPLQGVQAAIDEALAHTDKIGFVGPAVTDYPDLEALARQVVGAGGSFSTSSLKIGALGHEVTGLLREGHQRGAAIAPEAGSQRLRNLVNKPQTDEDIVRTVGTMAADGIDFIKMYLLVGLPTEEEADIDAIASLGERCRQVYLEACAARGRSGTLTLSVNPFIPKPATPFQWSPMARPETLQANARRIRSSINRRPPLQLDFMSPRTSVLQSYLSLGDRRVADFLRRVTEDGGGWWPKLKRIREEVDRVVFREKDRYELFPWDFIDTSVSRPWLWKEWIKASRSDITEICRVNDCISCSACMDPVPTGHEGSSVGARPKL